MSSKGKLESEPVYEAEVMLGTEDLEHILSEWFSKRVGLELPVLRRADWKWSPGKGPVLSLHIETVPNVRSLVLRRKRLKP